MTTKLIIVKLCVHVACCTEKDTRYNSSQNNSNIAAGKTRCTTHMQIVFKTDSRTNIFFYLFYFMTPKRWRRSRPGNVGMMNWKSLTKI